MSFTSSSGIAGRAEANKSEEANRRQASPFDGGRAFGRSVCAPASPSAPVAHLDRSAALPAASPANIFLFVFVLAATGCGNREAVLSPKNEVNVQLATKWMELTKLRVAADEHLRTRYTGFDPSSAEVTANIYRSESNSVMFQYFWNFGLPTYLVRFDSHGQITFSTNRIATEGH